MKIYVVHVYDAADHLHDYYVHGTVATAVRRAAEDIVTGRFEDLGHGDFDGEVQRVIDAAYEEPGVGRRHVRCDAWHAHIDEMPLLDVPAPALPTNPDCRGLIGTIGACGTESHYCSDHCWTIGQLKAARERVAEYERRLGLAGSVRS